jgi:hypothetical protein
VSVFRYSFPTACRPIQMNSAAKSNTLIDSFRWRMEMKAIIKGELAIDHGRKSCSRLPEDFSLAMFRTGVWRSIRSALVGKLFFEATESSARVHEQKSGPCRAAALRSVACRLMVCRVELYQMSSHGQAFCSGRVVNPALQPVRIGKVNSSGIPA